MSVCLCVCRVPPPWNLPFWYPPSSPSPEDFFRYPPQLHPRPSAADMPRSLALFSCSNPRLPFDLSPFPLKCGDAARAPEVPWSCDIDIETVWVDFQIFYLVGGLEHFFSPYNILGRSSSQLTFILFKGVGIPPTSYDILRYLDLHQHWCVQVDTRFLGRSGDWCTRLMWMAVGP